MSAHEAPGPTIPSVSSLRRLDLLALLALGLLVRIPLILAYPAIHGSDSVLRVARSDELLIGYWLPLPQLVVYLTRTLAPDPFWIRTLFALLGALTPLALAGVVAATAGAAAGRAAGVLVSLHPFLAYYSTVPYQEVLTLPLLLAGALALLRRRESLAGLSLGLACLCRYEAWIAATLAGVSRWRTPLRALTLFGWAPLLWLLAWRGWGPPGSYLLDLDIGAGRIHRLPFLLAKLREYAGDSVLLLAALGAYVTWRRRLRAWAWGGAFLALYLAAQAAVGHEYPPGSGLISERMAHLPALAVCALAGLALGAAADSASRRRRDLLALLALCCLMLWLGVGWLRRSWALVAAANQDPSLQLALEVARLADRQLSASGRMAVAGPPVSPEAVRDFLRKLEQSGRDSAPARAIARQTHVPDAYRIQAHIPRAPRTVLLAGAGSAELIAVFDDAPEPERWQTDGVVARFVKGNRGVTVYRLQPPAQ